MAFPNEAPRYPTWFYHAEQPAKMVANEQEEMLLSPGYQRDYIHQKFPAYFYHESHSEPRLVRNQDELDNLGKGWHSSKGHVDGLKAKAAEEITEKHAQFLRSKDIDCEDVEAAREFVAKLTPKQKNKFMAEARAWDPDKSDDWQGKAKAE